jgi:hypothetical protein
MLYESEHALIKQKLMQDASVTICSAAGTGAAAAYSKCFSSSLTIIQLLRQAWWATG